MDEKWESRKKDVDRFCNKNNIQHEKGNIQKVIYDSEYGEVGYISHFCCVLPDGTRMYEWP